MTVCSEVCLLTDERRVATIRAVSICDIFALHRSDFIAVVAEYPEVRHMMEKVAMQRLQKFGEGRECSESQEKATPSFIKPNELPSSLETAAAAVAAEIESQRLASRAVTAAEVNRRISCGLQEIVETTTWPEEVEEIDL